MLASRLKTENKKVLLINVPENISEAQGLINNCTYNPDIVFAFIDDINNFEVINNIF